MLTRIYADNYRCFTNFAFEPREMNLLVGANGTGKTYLFQLLADLRLLARSSDALRHLFDRSSLTRWEARKSQRFELTFEDANEGRYDWTVLVTFDEGDERARIEHETILKDGVPIAELEGGGKRLSIREEEILVPYALDGSLLSLRMDDPDLRALHRLVDGIVFLKLNVDAMEETSSRPNLLRLDGVNFASSYRQQRDKSFETTKALHDLLRQTINGFRSLEFEDVGKEAKRLVVKLLAQGGGGDYTVGLNELSDGQRALVVLYHVVVAYSRARPLCFDEPDNYVSLRELQPWLQAVTRACDDGAQVFIVSHNPEVIDYLAADHAWLFERDDGGPTRVRPLPIDRSSGLKASEQLARGWLRGA